MTDAARDKAAVAMSAQIERESDELEAMCYDDLVALKRAWLHAPPPPPRNGGKWGTDWNPKVALALRDQPVLKRYVLGDSTRAINFGRVVGCTDHFFQVLFEDGYEPGIMNWHELKQILVREPTRDAALKALEEEGLAGMRAMRRKARYRDYDDEAAAYLPRNGCHYSLPPGKVACHIHEALRLSGLYAHNDPGPAASD